MNYLRRVEELTVNLHSLIREGHGDSDESERLREEILDLWSQLSSEKKLIIDRLSGDLYQLADDEELFSSPNVAEEVGNLKQNYSEQNWGEVLKSLRYELGLSSSKRAYFRGRAYAELGLDAAAEAFYSHAAVLEPENGNYAYLALDALTRIGSPEAVFERAIGQLESNDSPIVRIGVAQALAVAARSAVHDLGVQIHEQIVILLAPIAEVESWRELSENARVSALLRRAFSAGYLGNSELARNMIDNVAHMLDLEPELVVEALSILEEMFRAQAKSNVREDAIRRGEDLAVGFFRAAIAA